MDLHQTKQIIYHSKGIDESYPKLYFLLNLCYCVKSYGHFCQILAFFMMLAHQIWSCHMAQDANFENLLFCSNFVFNIRKSHKFLVEKLSTSEVISQKPHKGRKTPHHMWDVQYSVFTNNNK